MLPTADFDGPVLSEIASFRVSARLMSAMRDMLRDRLNVPDGDLIEKQRARVERRMANLRKQHAWGDIDDLTYRRERAEAEAMLAALPDQDKLVQFDAYAARVYDVAEAIPHMTPEERKEIVRLFVDSVSLDGTIEWSGPYRAFLARVDTVSPEGSGDAVSTRLHWYTGEARAT